MPEEIARQRNQARVYGTGRSVQKAARRYLYLRYLSDNVRTEEEGSPSYRQQAQLPSTVQMFHVRQDFHVQVRPEGTSFDPPGRRLDFAALLRQVRLPHEGEEQPQVPLHQTAHGRLQVRLRTLREAFQDGVGPKVPRRDSQQLAAHVRYLRQVLHERLLPVQAPKGGAFERVQVPVRRLQQAAVDAGEPGQSHAATQPNVRVQGVREGVRLEKVPGHSHDHAHRRETVHLSRLREELSNLPHEEHASVDAFRGEAARLRPLWTFLQEEDLHDRAQEETSRRTFVLAACATWQEERRRTDGVTDIPNRDFFAILFCMIDK